MFFFVMILGRCFDIQRAVMLYCCPGNYDELFYIGSYLCVLPIFTLVLFLFSIFWLVGWLVYCYYYCYTIFLHIRLNCSVYFSVSSHSSTIFSGIWLDSHSCSAFNCIVSGLLLCIRTCKITFNC